VLAAFNVLTNDGTVVGSRSRRLWRTRQPTDEDRRAQREPQFTSNRARYHGYDAAQGGPSNGCAPTCGAQGMVHGLEGLSMP